jgi:hypothetical protein
MSPPEIEHPPTRTIWPARTHAAFPSERGPMPRAGRAGPVTRDGTRPDSRGGSGLTDCGPRAATDLGGAGIWPLAGRRLRADGAADTGGGTASCGGGLTGSLVTIGSPGTAHSCSTRSTGTGGDDRGIGEECAERRCVPRRGAERRPEAPDRGFAMPRHAASSSTSTTMTRTDRSAISHPPGSCAATPAILRTRRRVLRGSMPRSSDTEDARDPCRGLRLCSPI